MTETPIIQEIRLACSRGPVRLFRNNSGALEDKTGRWVQFGLAPGSADLIGYKTVVITPDMVGERFARFVSIEVKHEHSRTDKKRAEAQANWLKAVAESGGIAGVARTVDEARLLLATSSPARLG